jgi:ABC-type lipoprotein release transport system permease subunit
MMAMMSNISLFIMGIMLFLGFIVTNQLVDNAINEKTYENAMLRCLGWNQGHVILTTVLKSILFQMVPGAILGIFLAKILNDVVKAYIVETTKFDIVLDFHW